MIRRVLIVEPDPRIAGDLFSLFHSESGRFEHERYEPEIAESFAEAVEQAQTVNFHCVIIDAKLPEMDGYEAVPIIKTISKNIPIIITTGENALEMETKAREQNVYYYHIRASNGEDLKMVVGSVFEKPKKAEVGPETDRAAAKPVTLKRLSSFKKG